MRKPKIYLETTIFNYCYAEDTPDRQYDNNKLFRDIKDGIFEPFTSTIVVDELLKSKEPKRSMMLQLISEYDISVLSFTTEIDELARAYVNNGIIPVKFIDDARHIACATVYDTDIIVSWNFKHIVRRKTIIMTEQINLLQGYRKIEIYSPSEVISDDES